MFCGRVFRLNNSIGLPTRTRGVSQAASSIETGSIEGLTSLLSGGGEVRETLVAEIKLKIQAGEYLTQQSAVETADAILNL
jgi:anti-sigma28 factor (negative regulator of flagellin synthesis)